MLWISHEYTGGPLELLPLSDDALSDDPLELTSGVVPPDPEEAPLESLLESAGDPDPALSALEPEELRPES